MSNVVLSLQERQNFMASIGFGRYPELLNPAHSITRMRPVAMERVTKQVIDELERIVRGLGR